MKKISPSVKTYAGLIILLGLLTFLNFYLPQGGYAILQENLPAPKLYIALASIGIVIVFYGALGFLGLFLSKKLGFPEIWDKKVSNKNRFLYPAIVGGIMGTLLIVGDLIFSQFNGIGHLIHPSFPSSIVFSLAAGIGEETFFRLFFISFWTWFISSVILKKRWQTQIFWIVSVISALLFAAGHFPSLFILYGFKSIADVSVPLIIEIFLLNGIVGLSAAYYFRKYGFLAAAGIHFWVDIVFHVIFGLILLL